ncbi:hypothetical protein HHK36_020592 [Tetracentron sinense]|uniref:Bifunctional inhibitor/plant lipid transfer protein/seed storage helical domain-containing protein n=1 Tax=Tetracentron sinense TaxID=13715 RepID=A0A835DBR9_TETSI|nr:hypothetical protein HHK36_020592 [Tetracentron sinense]
MEGFKGFGSLIAVSVMVFGVSILPVYGQIGTPCTASMITSFTPCMNFITGSTGNGSSPTASCCSSLKSLVSGSSECACLIVTGNVPLPINRTVAISLPRACNMGSVPLHCKSSGSPLAAPGPLALGPTPPPTDAPSSSSKDSSAPESASPAMSPQSDTTLPITPASSPVDSETPTTTGIRPVLTPSAANPSHISSPSLLIFVLGIMISKFY